MASIALCRSCQLELWAVDVGCPRCGAGEGPSSRVSGSGDRRFEIRDTLGSGGMGIVYEARDRELDDIVALKVLDPQFGGVEEAVERFKSELKIARRIRHPNVAQVYDLVVWRGRLAISEELIRGRSLESLLASGPLPLAEVRGYARYICSGLYSAHQVGVVHQDLKPANVIVDAHGRPHILDFGIARLVDSQRVMGAESVVYGTPAYMSPEQAYEPDTVDPRSDLYSLGIMLYRMLCAEVPFDHGDPQKIFAAHLTEQPRPPSAVLAGLPPAIDRIILRCLAKRREDRYANAHDLLAALETALPAAPPILLRPEGSVLVVDDDRLTRRIVGDAIRRRGLRVVEAENGFRGVEIALAAPPSLILLDLMMPVLDGREALRILKNNPITRDVPVVVMTALEDSSEESWLARDVGAAAFLNKPVEDAVLEILLEKFAGSHQMVD